MLSIQNWRLQMFIPQLNLWLPCFGIRWFYYIISSLFLNTLAIVVNVHSGCISETKCLTRFSRYITFELIIYLQSCHELYCYVAYSCSTIQKCGKTSLLLVWLLVHFIIVITCLKNTWSILNIVIFLWIL